MIAKRSAKQAMPVAYLVTAAIALLIWQVPLTVIAAFTIEGLVMAAEILYIVFGAILLLNILKASGAIGQNRTRSKVNLIYLFKVSEGSSPNSWW